MVVGLRGLPGSLLAHRTGRTYAPSFRGAERSRASRADPGFLCCVPNAKESTSPNNAPSAQRPSGAAGRTRWLRPSPADGASNPRRPCEGPRRALGSGRLSSREGHAPTPRTTREARRAARRAGPPRTTARLPGPPAAAAGVRRDGVVRGCYLVDPASSHMLVSKIKPCMCKYELIQTVKLRMAH